MRNFNDDSVDTDVSISADDSP